MKKLTHVPSALTKMLLVYTLSPLPHAAKAILTLVINGLLEKTHDNFVYAFP